MEKTQLISTGEEDSEAPESDEEEHKSACKGADEELEQDHEVQEVAPEDSGAGGDPDDDPDDGGDSDGDAAGYRTAAE